MGCLAKVFCFSAASRLTSQPGPTACHHDMGAGPRGREHFLDGENVRSRRRTPRFGRWKRALSVQGSPIWTETNTAHPTTRVRVDGTGRVTTSSPSCSARCGTTSPYRTGSSRTETGPGTGDGTRTVHAREGCRRKEKVTRDSGGSTRSELGGCKPDFPPYLLRGGTLSGEPVLS